MESLICYFYYRKLVFRFYKGGQLSTEVTFYFQSTSMINFTLSTTQIVEIMLKGIEIFMYVLVYMRRIKGGVKKKDLILPAVSVENISCLIFVSRSFYGWKYEPWNQRFEHRHMDLILLVLKNKNEVSPTIQPEDPTKSEDRNDYRPEYSPRSDTNEKG